MIWDSMGVLLAPAYNGGPHNPNNLSGLALGWRPRLTSWLEDAAPVLSYVSRASTVMVDELMCLGVSYSNYLAVVAVRHPRQAHRPQFSAQPGSTPTSAPMRSPYLTVFGAFVPS